MHGSCSTEMQAGTLSVGFVAMRIVPVQCLVNVVCGALFSYLLVSASVSSVCSA